MSAELIAKLKDAIKTDGTTDCIGEIMLNWVSLRYFGGAWVFIFILLKSSETLIRVNLLRFGLMNNRRFDRSFNAD